MIRVSSDTRKINTPSTFVCTICVQKCRSNDDDRPETDEHGILTFDSSLLLQAAYRTIEPVVGIVRFFCKSIIG